MFFFSKRKAREKHVEVEENEMKNLDYLLHQYYATFSTSPNFRQN